MPGGFFLRELCKLESAVERKELKDLIRQKDKELYFEYENRRRNKEKERRCADAPQ